MAKEERFRDSIATIDEKGKRAWIFPKKPNGKLYKYRKLVSYVLLLILFLSPFIKINGNQLFLFNILERRFNIFSFPFWPQDFYLFVISMIIGVVFVAAFTAAFGRLFCGWVCPQTIFMEMVFRRIEYWIEGDRGSQIRLSKQKWDAEKVRKKVIKHFLFVATSFVIANVFLGYLIGGDVVVQYITDGAQAHLNTLLSLVIFTSVFYFVFSWFREQVCVIACPYGRLQSVLLDQKSVVVAYDYVRGEGRSGRKKLQKNEERSQSAFGHCIDCNQCVHVCPTGIDIRNGTQLECVNCTACIDACDHIMTSVKLPTRLITFSSEDSIKNSRPFKFTLRMKGYAAVLTILLGVLISMIVLRNDTETVVLRLPGQLYTRIEDGIIRNVYTYKIINKTTQDIEGIQFQLLNNDGIIHLVPEGREILLKRQGQVEGTMFIDIPTNLLSNDKNMIRLGVYSRGKLIESTKFRFLGPRAFY